MISPPHSSTAAIHDGRPARQNNTLGERWLESRGVASHQTRDCDPRIKLGSQPSVAFVSQPSVRFFVRQLKATHYSPSIRRARKCSVLPPNNTNILEHRQIYLKNVDGAVLECKGEGNGSTPDKTSRQAASSSTVPICTIPAGHQTRISVVSGATFAPISIIMEYLHSIYLVRVLCDNTQRYRMGDGESLRHIHIASFNVSGRHIRRARGVVTPSTSPDKRPSRSHQPPRQSICTENREIKTGVRNYTHFLTKRSRECVELRALKRSRTSGRGCVAVYTDIALVALKLWVRGSAQTSDNRNRFLTPDPIHSCFDTVCPLFRRTLLIKPLKNHPIPLASHQGEPGSIPGRVTPLDFRMWESCRTMPGFLGDLPVSPAPSFRRCSLITLVGSQDLAVKSRPNPLTHSLSLPSGTQKWTQASVASALHVGKHVALLLWRVHRAKQRKQVSRYVTHTQRPGRLHSLRHTSSLDNTFSTKAFNCCRVFSWGRRLKVAVTSLPAGDNPSPPWPSMTLDLRVQDDQGRRLSSTGLATLMADSSPFLLQPVHELSNGFWPSLTSPHQAIQYVPKMFYRVEVGALSRPVQSANIVVGIPLHSLLWRPDAAGDVEDGRKSRDISLAVELSILLLDCGDGRTLNVREWRRPRSLLWRPDAAGDVEDGRKSRDISLAVELSILLLDCGDGRTLNVREWRRPRTRVCPPFLITAEAQSGGSPGPLPPRRSHVKCRRKEKLTLYPSHTPSKQSRPDIRMGVRLEENSDDEFSHASNTNDIFTHMQFSEEDICEAPEFSEVVDIIISKACAKKKITSGPAKSSLHSTPWKEEVFKLSESVTFTGQNSLPEDVLILDTPYQRLSWSPPTKANRARSPVGSPDFRKWESYRTMTLVGGFSRGSPITPALSSRRRSIFASFHLHRLSRPRC
ncbi:hypothetical protein PR048_027343 [Dryococelus australis]|uniref:Uncharacterized protein n=1 Tax=Dryococelus australis TaxID=614101 RepID=A0ABQ9GF70_9NEOP|nr:hypothetical protein PR048_027343 [Dryococelus australis]